MPLTDFQREVLGVVGSNRSEQSHFADGLVLHARLLPRLEGGHE